MRIVSLWAIVMGYMWLNTGAVCAQRLVPTKQVDPLPDTVLSSTDVPLSLVDTLPPAVDTYYTLPYDPSGVPPMPFDQHRRPSFDQRHKRPTHFYPKSYTKTLRLDTNMHYTLQERIGGINYRPPLRVPFSVYAAQHHQNTVRNYWKQRTKEADGDSPVSSRGHAPRIYLGPKFNRVFGGDFVSFNPNILFTIDLATRWQGIENPALPINRRRNFLLDMKQQLTTNIVGEVGEKLDVTFNYDTQSPFGSFTANFKNNIRVEYEGFKEDIMKKFVVGNVSMPLGNSLIRGAQSLFGISSKYQFGKLYFTNVISTQRGTADNLVIEGGTQSSTFSVSASNYEADQYFFLAHFFRENYERWLAQRPQITSGINITRVEVYILNRKNNPANLRSVLAFLDLGESSHTHRIDNPHIGTGAGEELVPVGNAANQLFSEVKNASNSRNLESVDDLLHSWGLEQSIDYEKISSARRLAAHEYEVHPSLGYIRFAQSLQSDEILAVAYEYTYNGERYKVGELLEDYQNIDVQQAIFLKLLRNSRVNTEIPTWDLMMKNVYAIGVGNLRPKDFSLQIHYRDDTRGLDNPNLQEGVNLQGRPLVELLGLDTLNPNNDPPKDGNFDYLEDITVHSELGVVIFPVLEPFGRTLQSYFDPDTEKELIEKYIYEPLYRDIQANSDQLVDLNKYTLNGTYSTGGAGGDFQLPAFGVVENSVQVSVSGRTLTEGNDYTVDYALGRVNITNNSILESGQKINISYEKGDFLSTRNRTLIGNRLDYDISKELSLGATLMYLTDQQGSISRYQLGTEPIRNMKYGFDMNWERESLLLTKLLDKLPLISTKTPSLVRVNAEVAQLLPNTSNLIKGERVFYIDDFESTVQPMALSNFRTWKLASTPEVVENTFDKSSTQEPLGAGYQRARISWYTIDNDFYFLGSTVDRNTLGSGGITNHYVRQVKPTEIFPFRDVGLGVVSESVFNVAYFPAERGPYNYHPALTAAGRLPNPQASWGGITRGILGEVNFDNTGIQYLEFWLMDPFLQDEQGKILDGVENTNNVTGGTLIFNLGDISEDITQDGRLGFENGLPANGSDQGVTRTPWGRVTTSTLINRAFESNPTARANQDVGYDGLSDEAERSFFQRSFLTRLSPEAAASVQLDPSADNFSFYLTDALNARNAGIIERYKYFNNSDGNTQLNTGGLNTIGSTYPENEDLNQNNTLNDLEAYYSYVLELMPGQMQVGNGYIVDQVHAGGGVNWYLFRIPIRKPDRVHGNISGFQAIKYARMYLTNFQQPVVLRFVRMQLVGTQWNDYEKSLAEEGITPGANTTVNFSAVGIEENNTSLPGKSPYVLPPGISRDENDFSFTEQRYNEQSMQLCLENLIDGDARAVFKELDENLVNYKRLQMFFHLDGEQLADGDLQAFIRFGPDYDRNYYEIALPLKVTPANLSGAGIDRLVWPEENEIDLALDELYAIKLRRDREGYNPTKRYKKILGRHTVYVVGQPKISQVKLLMIGVRNPQSPDKIPKNGCLWANELRTTGINSKQGWATNLNMDTRLADFADVSFNTQYSTPGFGDVQDGVQQRSLTRNLNYDISSAVHLDKLLPAKTGLKLPMFMSYTVNSTEPEYDPFNSDIPLSASLLSLDEADRTHYKEVVTVFNQQRSINFTNVRKERLNTERKPYFFDPENFALTYAYNDRMHQSSSIHHELYKQHHGALNYEFTRTADYIKLFKVGNNPYLRWLNSTDISFFPQNFTFSLDMRRRFQRKQVRNVDFTDIGIDPVFEKAFTFDQVYVLQWDILRSLKLQYNARTAALIDEADGDLDTPEKRQKVWDNILKFGRVKDFTQNIRAQYNLPLSVIPLLDWANATFGYRAGYVWRSGSRAQISTLGNSIENMGEISANISLNMRSLYDKFSFLAPPPSGAIKYFINIVTMLQNVHANFTQHAETLLPGYLPVPEWMGTNANMHAPGWRFLLGGQDPAIREQAAEQGWLVRNASLTLPFRQQLTQAINVQATLIPIPDISVQLNVTRNSTGGYQEIFRYDDVHNRYTTLTPSRNGTYALSYLSIRTAFASDEKAVHAFNTFAAYRTQIKNRLEAQHPTHAAYTLHAQDVLIPAFLAAYTGYSPEKQPLTPFPTVPLPNWQLTYQGLNKIKALSTLFSSVTLTHGYSSTYAVGNFSNSLLYDPLYLGNGLNTYQGASFFENGQLVPFYIINRVGIVERFSPLIGLNVSLKNDMSLRFELRKTRELNLDLSNTQLHEIRTRDFTIDYSFSRESIRLPIYLFGRNRVLENTFTLRVGFVLKSTQEWQRAFNVEEIVTAGNLSVQYRGSVDYAINKFVNLQIYVDQGDDTPQLTNAFPRDRTAVGFRFRVNWSE